MDRRGVVALWIALFIPTFLLCIALPVEFGQRAVAKLRTQRTTDLAALAGMMAYQTDVDANKARAKEVPPLAPIPEAEMESDAMTAAGLLGLLNKATVTAEMVAGVSDGSGHAMAVRASQAVPLVMLNAIAGQVSFTISASSTAELIDDSAKIVH